MTERQVAEYPVGSLVRVRERNWVVLPSDDPDILCLRPLSGSESEIFGIHRAIEGREVDPAKFAPPQPEKAGDFIVGKLLRKAARLGLDSGDAKSLSKDLKLEGSTHADCLIECEKAFVWIEGKRNDWLSPSTKWDITRDQLARNLEAAWQLAGQSKKDFWLLIRSWLTATEPGHGKLGFLICQRKQDSYFGRRLAH